jgi:hypothetical protein
MLKIMEINPEAHAEMKVANTNYSVSIIFSCIGGFMVGYQLGTSVGGGEPDWTLAVVGVGLPGVSIPSGTSYTKHKKNAA